MNLQESLLRLKQKQLELQEEEKNIKQELEKILFGEDFHYETLKISESESYVYPCIKISKPFQVSDEKINVNKGTVFEKCYNLITTDPHSATIKVQELAFLKPKKKNFILNEIHGTVECKIIFQVFYTIKIEDFRFEFTKDIPEEKIFENNTETFNMKNFSDVLQPATLRNKQIVNNFIASLNPYLYEKQKISFKDSVVNNARGFLKLHLAANVFCSLEINRKVHEKSFSMNLNCNQTKIEFIGKFEVIDYSARVMLITLTGNKKIVEFSDSGYCVPLLIIGNNKEVQARTLFM